MTEKELFERINVGDRLIITHKRRDGWSYDIVVTSKMADGRTLLGNFTIRKVPANYDGRNFPVGTDIGQCEARVGDYDWEFPNESLDDLLMRVYRTGKYDRDKLQAYLTELH